MIRNEAEYKDAVSRLAAGHARLSEQKARLEEKGFTDEEVKRATDPLQSFQLRLAEEVECYEKLRRGEFEDVLDISRLGRLLISLRIASGTSQRELAGRLGVHESQVSRDERNEYFGITIERAAKIIQALRYTTRTTVSEGVAQDSQELELT